METKFTKGPWVIRKGDGAIGIKDKSDTQSYGMLNVIAMIDRYDYPSDWMYNLQLIAAAPDGYKAAESAYLTLLKVRTFSDRLSDGFQESLIHLRNFIAKATGRTEEDVQNEFEAKARGEQP